jgi:hypothetical protein
MNACLTEFDPYSIQAGRELDALIHHRVLKQALSHSYPRYSSDSKAADQVKRMIEAEYGNASVTGTTEIRAQRWFARYELELGNPTEALAETYPLAICRLALLRVSERK